MSRSGEFCPRCGETVEGRVPGPTARDRALCTDCYLDEYDLVDAPDRVEVQVCAECGAVERGDRWVDIGAQDYTDVAIDAVREALGVHVDASEVSWQVAPEQVDETTIRMHAQFTGTLRGRPLAEEVIVPVKLGRGTCRRCGRIAGGSYASVVQVRADGRDPDDHECDRAAELAHELVAAHEADGDREAFVTEIAPVAGGIDVRLSTTQLGEQLARRLVGEFGGSYTDHERLITEDEDGQPVYRVTYAVRLPPYRPGEVLDPGDGDGPVLVRGADDRLTGVRLPTPASHTKRASTRWRTRPTSAGGPTHRRRRSSPLSTTTPSRCSTPTPTRLSPSPDHHMSMPTPRRFPSSGAPRRFISCLTLTRSCRPDTRRILFPG